MGIFGKKVSSLGVTTADLDGNKRDLDEFLKNLDKRVKDIVFKETEILTKFKEEIGVISERGFHYTLARTCRVPKRIEDEFKTDYCCESYKSCTLFLSGDCPEGSRCPFEIMYIDHVSKGMISSINIDPDNDFMEMQALIEYVTYSLSFFRSSRAIASASAMALSIEGTKFGTDYKKSTNPYFEVMDMASKNMARLKKELVSTRESKLSFKIFKTNDDPKEKKEKQLAEACYTPKELDMIEGGEKN